MELQTIDAIILIFILAHVFTFIESFISLYDFKLLPSFLSFHCLSLLNISCWTGPAEINSLSSCACKNAVISPLVLKRSFVSYLLGFLVTSFMFCLLFWAHKYISSLSFGFQFRMKSSDNPIDDNLHVMNCFFPLLSRFSFYLWLLKVWLQRVSACISLSSSYFKFIEKLRCL